VPFKIYCPKIGGEMLLRVVACRPMRKAARVFFGSLAHNRGLKPAFAGAWDCGGARTGFDRACIALLEWFAAPEGVAGACIALLVGCVATAGVAGACVALVAWFAALCCGSRHLCVAGACIALGVGLLCWRINTITFLFHKRAVNKSEGQSPLCFVNHWRTDERAAFRAFQIRHSSLVANP